MNWSSINTDVLGHYQKLGQFRRNHLSVGGGTHTKLKDSPYTFKRELGTDKVVVVTGASGATTVNVSGVFADGTQVQNFYTSTSGVVMGGNVTFTPDSKGIILIESTGGSNPTVSISPASGNYLSGSTIQVTMSATGVGTKTIYYTLNGTQPTTTTGSLVYSTPISVNTARTINAMAVQADGKSSSVVSNQYTFNPAPPTVTVNPAGPHTSFGSFNLTISGVDDSGILPTLHYTTNGSTPTTASPSAVGIKTISVTSNMTLKVFGVDNNGLASAIQTHDYTVTTISGFTVYLKKPSTWAGAARIHYWNTMPTGILAATAWPGLVMATAPGTNWFKHTFTNITTTSLIFNDGTNQTVDLTRSKNGWYMNGAWFDANPENAAPILTPSLSCGFSSPTGFVVTITGTDDSGILPTIYYTTDGTTPTTASPSGVGKVAISITTTTTVKFFAVDNTGLASAVATCTYSVVNNPPVVAVSIAGPFTSSSAFNVTITGTDDSGVAPKIYTTTDGSTPTTLLGFTSGTKVITVANTQTLKVFAVDNQGVASAIQTHAYTISTVSGTGFTVYFNKPAAWSTTAIRIHYWNSLPAGNLAATVWPGVVTTADGANWYKFTFTNITSTSLIFNDNGSTTNKTADLTRNKTGYYSNGVWSDTDPRVVVTTSGITIHYFNASNWATPTIYFWNVGATALSTDAAPFIWPGKPMLSEGNSWFKYTIANAGCARIIFSNNGATQTPDLSRCGDGWYKNSTWSNTQPARESGDEDENSGFTLEQNRPNPFSQSTTINFTLPYSTVADLSVQSLLGQKVSVFTGKQLDKGTHQVEFSRADLPAGVYVFILNAEGKSLYRKFIIE